MKSQDNLSQNTKNIKWLAVYLLVTFFSNAIAQENEKFYKTKDSTSCFKSPNDIKNYWKEAIKILYKDNLSTEAKNIKIIRLNYKYEYDFIKLNINIGSEIKKDTIVGEYIHSKELKNDIYKIMVTEPNGNTFTCYKWYDKPTKNEKINQINTVETPPVSGSVVSDVNVEQLMNNVDELKEAQELIKNRKTSMSLEMCKEIEKWEGFDYDISQYYLKKFDSQTLTMLRKYLQKNVNLYKYAKNDFNWRQLNEIGKTLINDLDVSKVALKSLNHKQMSVIRKAMALGIDVDKIDNSLDPSQMKEQAKMLWKTENRGTTINTEIKNNKQN